MLLYYNVASLQTYKISIDWKILVYGAGSPAPYTRIFQSIDIL